MLDWFKTRSLNDVINETKKVRINGVIFTIRKINPLDYLTGAKVLQRVFSNYAREQKTDQVNESDIKLMKNHMKDVILSGVVKPELTRNINKEPKKIDVEDIFIDWDLALDLHNKIMEFTYGSKKKISQLASISPIQPN